MKRTERKRQEKNRQGQKGKEEKRTNITDGKVKKEEKKRKDIK